DELMQCYMLRAAVFMGEQHCPYWEEFDGNDYTASHLMLYVDGEPAASMRIRWFASFAKLERAIILKRYRSYGLFIPFVDWARELEGDRDEHYGVIDRRRDGHDQARHEDGRLTAGLRGAGGLLHRRTRRAVLGRVRRPRLRRHPHHRLCRRRAGGDAARALVS